MLQIQHGPASLNCKGMTRRTALKAGFLGLSGLTLPDLFRLRAEGSARNTDTACILIWLDGGPSQLESYDPKPEAPAEYRGPFGTIQTKVPGVRVSSVLPGHARHADKLALIRSLHHDNGDHFAAAHWMLTGRLGSNAANQAPKYPGVGAYVAKVRGPNTPGLPPFVGLPAAHSVYIYPGYQGGAYLGPAYNPFDVDRVQKYLAASSNVQVRTPKWLRQFSAEAAASTQSRKGLLSHFDTIRRDIDRSGVMESLDRFQQDAMTMILGGQARQAFDIDQEDPRAADRYGTGPWGRYTLMARRLVEAGVTFVTVDMPHWDDHSRIEESHARKLGPLDQAVGALLDDLQERGLFDRVMVVVMGEFGRTPRLNTGQPGIPIPGRDHWGNAISAMIAGGGIRGGQVIGATNARAEHPVDRPLKPADLLATVYHGLGIDTTLTFEDHSGRPIPILDEGRPISELL